LGRFPVSVGYTVRMTLTIRRLGSGDAEAFERALAIYREAIEPSEQRTEAELWGALGRSDYLILAALRGQSVVGLAIAFLPHAEDFWLLEYVATAPSERGQGAGERLVREASLAARARIGLVEVDEPHGSPETIAMRRVRFYRRLGYRQIGALSYLLPLRTHGVPPPMFMLAFTPSVVASIPARTIERWLRVIYVEVYSQRADDPRIAGMISVLPVDALLV
jgi:GNAT superfamily N-acetyltransferase